LRAPPVKTWKPFNAAASARFACHGKSTDDRRVVVAFATHGRVWRAIAPSHAGNALLGRNRRRGIFQFKPKEEPMFSIFPNLIVRLKVLVLTFIVADLEADLVAATADRKAELLCRAKQYEQDNLPSVAEQLRQQAEALAPDTPLASVAGPIAHLQTDQTLSAAADVPASLSAAAPAESPPPPSKKKKA
jgi:hypothetical protein